jgi:hypothetical protein
MCESNLCSNKQRQHLDNAVSSALSVHHKIDSILQVDTIEKLQNILKPFANIYVTNIQIW